MALWHTILVVAFLNSWMSQCLSAGQCQQDWSLFNNSCFKFYSEKKNWTDAESQCTQNNGHLTSIMNSAENGHVKSLLSGTAWAWIGFHDRTTENKFEWSDGSSVTYTNWIKGEPNSLGNEDCANVDVASGEWNDFGCRHLGPFVCRKAPSSTSTTPTSTAIIPTTHTSVATTHAATTTQTLAGQCQQDWSSFNNSCFKFYSERKSWADAESQCVQNNGHLTSIRSSAENGHVNSLLSGTVWAWIGFHDRTTENMFEWSDGSSVTYTDWKTGEPNNLFIEDCTKMEAASGEWNDAQCGKDPYPFVCRKAASSTSTTPTSTAIIPTTHATTTTQTLAITSKSTVQASTTTATTDTPTTKIPTTQSSKTLAPLFTTQTWTSQQPTTQTATTSPMLTTETTTTRRPKTQRPRTRAAATEASTTTSLSRTIFLTRQNSLTVSTATARETVESPVLRNKNSADKESDDESTSLLHAVVGVVAFLIVLNVVIVVLLVILYKRAYRSASCAMNIDELRENNLYEMTNPATGVSSQVKLQRSASKMSMETTLQRPDSRSRLAENPLYQQTKDLYTSNQ